MSFVLLLFSSCRSGEWQGDVRRMVDMLLLLWLLMTIRILHFEGIFHTGCPGRTLSMPQL